MELTEHKERHELLHRMLDELFADYMNHHPKQVEFLKMPIGDLMKWSYSQTINPTDLKRMEQ